ncbi:MAG: hemin uptake protein HemP [Thiohalocapsa sp.]
MNQPLGRGRNQQSCYQAATAKQSPKRVASDDLLDGGNRLIIEHGEWRYMLLLTRNGKLILTK